jgi:enamidase
VTWDGTFDPGAFGPPGGSLELRNLRGVVSGRLGAAPLAAETLRVEAGRVVSAGAAPADADVVVDAAGAVAVPGLVDTHCHVVFGDYTPRQHAVGFLESYLHGGVTQVMSASEVHLPGRPRDRAGVKALAVAAQRAWSGFRPGGVKVRGGSLICEPVLAEEDFAELAAEGVRYMKVGFGAFADPLEAVPLVGWAQAAGFVVMSHSGGASIPGSSPITVDHLLAMDPTIAGHANGGTTSLPDADLARLVDGSEMALQIVQAGNLRSALHLLGLARDRGRLDRVILGTDTPSGTGVMPLGLLKTVAELASLGGLEPADALALATGNAGRVLGVAEGVLEPGRPADLVLLQEPLGGTRADPLAALAVGDLPGIAGVVVDGAARVLRSRNTPAPAREATVTGRSAARWPR